MRRSTGVCHHLRTPVMAALAALVLAAVPLGCGKALLSPTDVRSQYDRYDRVRNEYATQTLEDAYGVRRPNLQQRLRPKN
ncbi:MAG: hypothetical protein SFZ24_03030 [Planctomycetota bacterium]|nr:hypothetical protein [Planctomycetota bacterium]